MREAQNVMAEACCVFRTALKYAISMAYFLDLRKGWRLTLRATLAAPALRLPNLN
jgi:hypothetical protein